MLLGLRHHFNVSTALALILQHGLHGVFTLPSLVRVPQRPRPLAPLTCLRKIPESKAKPPRQARLYTTGERLLVQPLTEDASTKTNGSAVKQTKKSSNCVRYIVCPECSTAYIGNAVTSPVKVSCASCSAVFQTSPPELFIPAPETSSQSSSFEISETKAKNSIICKHMRVCSGCTLSQNVNKPALLTEAREFFARAFNMKENSLTVEMGITHGWRTHAKLAIRRLQKKYSSSNQILLGLFRSKSHHVVPIPECAVHAPEISQAAEIVRATLTDKNIAPYDETTGRGLARYALFTLERGTKLVQVTLVWNASNWKDAAPDAQVIGAELWRRGKGLLHSVWFNWNTSTGNAITVPEINHFYHMHGKSDLIEIVSNVQLTFPPYVFRQANLDTFEKLLLPKLLTYIPKDGVHITELYAGIGVIGLAAVRHCNVKRLIASEIHDGAKDAFWNSVTWLRKQGFGKNTTLEFIIASDEEAVETIDTNMNLVIVDPPRGGLASTVATKLAEFDMESNLSRIIYVSCGFDSFKRDAKILCQDGMWSLTAAHLYVLFPGSDHLETLAIFDRQRKNRFSKLQQSHFRKRKTDSKSSWFWWT